MPVSYEELLAAHERLQAENSELRLKLMEALTRIDELVREIFGPKADRLTPEQEEQLKQVKQDLEEEARRPGPLSDETPVEEEPPEKQGRKPARRPRHLLPEHLETETVIIEPDLALCECGGATKVISVIEARSHPDVGGKNLRSVKFVFETLRLPECSPPAPAAEPNANSRPEPYGF